MKVVKCERCGEQIEASNFNQGDTITCPKCNSAVVLRDWDVRVGDSRSVLRWMGWPMTLVVYSTAIIYIALETSFEIYSKGVTYGIAFFWVVVPIVVYLSVRDRQEDKEKLQEVEERRKDLDREMLAARKSVNRQ